MHTHSVRPMLSARAGERGMALVTTMFFTMALLMLSAALLTNASTESQTSANHVAQLQAFYAAEAGLAQAKAWLSANRGDSDLMDALLIESQTATPDQSSLTLPDATVVATPLGPQTFANGTYNVVISDNIDDADPLTDADLRWIIGSQGGGPVNASALLEEEVLGTSPVNPSGALGSPGNNINVDFEQTGGGPGTRIPPAPIDGRPHDLAGNLLAPGAGCQGVPPLATEDDVSTTGYIEELDTMRSNIVTRANSNCNPDGTDSGPRVCTPGLWWVRGSGVAERFDPGEDDVGVPTSFKLLNLRSPELHATGADYVTITQPPTVTLPAPATAPFTDAIGNVVVDADGDVVAEPLVSQVTPAVMAALLAAAQTVKDAYPAGDTITAPGNNNNAVLTYGSATDPKLVIANGNLRIRNGSTFTGFGILAVETLLEIKDSTFNWTGIVLVGGNNPKIETASSNGQFLGAVLFDPAGNTDPAFDMDKNSGTLAIRYSCDAIDLASSYAPVQTLSWIALHQ